MSLEAQKAHEKKAAACLATLTRISQEVIRRRDEITTADWADVGDMQHALEELNDIAHLLNAPNC